jgi:hypothetical protein
LTADASRASLGRKKYVCALVSEIERVRESVGEREREIDREIGGRKIERQRERERKKEKERQR